MFTFERTQTNTIFLTVLRLTGSAPAFPTDYNTPKVRISHISSGSEVEDLAFASMTQIGTSNQWFKTFDVPGAAKFTEHLVTFKTTLDGAEVFTAEQFQVVPTVSGGGPGSGTFAVTLQIKNSLTLDPIPDATIRVFDKSSPTIVLATTQTDANGNGTIFLAAGTYLVEFNKTGVISEVHDLVVFTDGTHAIIGD